METETPACRHCGGEHYIQDCPRVVAAFGPIVHRQQRGQHAHPPSDESVRANRIAARQRKQERKP